MPLDEDERTALVTGANRGLGLETCRQLGRKALRVILASRDTAKGQDAAARLSANGLSVSHARLDVLDSADIAAFVEHLKNEYRTIDVLVNNAGVALDGFNADVARMTLAVNLFGAMNVTDAVLPLLSKRANIVMVSSGMGEVSCVSRALRSEFQDPLLSREHLRDFMESFVRSVEARKHEQEGWPTSAYRVSKVGLNAFTRILARELGDTGIHVNAVCPGWVRTDMGGPSAWRSVEVGARSIVWAATLPTEGPTGGFFRDGEAIQW